jgi:methenyltetrahydromethanopterin cyclohydrolase
VAGLAENVMLLSLTTAWLVASVTVAVAFAVVVPSALIELGFTATLMLAAGPTADVVRLSGADPVILGLT